MASVPRLVMQGVCKRFGSTRALAGVDLELRPGEVHALIGENGAGKSTLMKVLAGAEVADDGQMWLDGQPFRPAGPDDARRHGVAMIYQELTLAPHLSVEANVLLGLEPTAWGFLRRGEGRRRVVQALAELEHPEIDPDSPVQALSPAACQVVEIARALLVDVRVLVFDEPTSSLTQEDARRLFALVRRLRDRGVSVVYISHFLEELGEIADRYTVLRDGRSVGTGELDGVDLGRIVEQMVGRQLTDQFPRVPHAIGAPVLQLAGLNGDPLPRGVTLTLQRGEILGLAGIVGAGRTELLRAVFGLDAVRSGLIQVVAYSDAGATPADRIRQGVGLLSEDRKGEGLALIQSIEDNLTYSRLRPYGRFGWLDLGRRRRAVGDWLSQLRVRCAGPTQPVGQLSGGNQQKVALGRLLHQQADVLLLDEPTRGVDVGSKAEIYRLIGEQAAAGKAVLFVSSYLPELLGVCDRVAVMTRGRLIPPRPVEAWTADEIMAYATGARSERG
ncbi:MAG: sugar ABC transporter ATP-binding protein [Gemmataceae bacterium]